VLPVALLTVASPVLRDFLRQSVWPVCAGGRLLAVFLCVRAKSVFCCTPLPLPSPPPLDLFFLFRCPLRELAARCGPHHQASSCTFVLKYLLPFGLDAMYRTKPHNYALVSL
jgi:hypothetical protein